MGPVAAKISHGYQLVEDIPETHHISDRSMETKSEASAAPQEPPQYEEGPIIKINDAIEAIGMGK